MNQPRTIHVTDGIVSESTGHSICWASIFGGAATAIAFSILLLMLGSGLGLTSISPWSNSGVGLTTFTVGAAIWLIVMQWLSSAFGGYLAARLRAKWIGVHTDEVLFRDTAHGFLSWAVATVVTVGLVGGTAASAIGGAMHATTVVAGGAAMGASHASAKSSETDAYGYYVDGLYRKNTPDRATSNQDVAAETTRILTADLKNDTIPEEDKAYLSRLVAAHAGISQDEAHQRVDKTISDLQSAKQKAKEDADAARKAAAKFTFYLFFSMLVGAFVATAGGGLGGQHRNAY